ncbi:MAG: Ig-like domain-containing protein [Candidatus Bathyarchaeia archaeon]
MKKLKSKSMTILIAAFLMFSMAASTILIPSANAHSPPWQIPTYAYIVASPNPIGVGQTIQVYMWLDEVYGAAGGTTAAVGTNGATASAALLSNTYRFINYNLTIVPPSGSPTTTIFPVIKDTTSNQETAFTPTQTGTYTLIFTYPGQVYGANGDGYSGSILINDTYLPSSTRTTLTVQSSPIAAPIGSSPLPTAYWLSPVYGENTNWYTLTSNWLGSGLAPPQGYGGTTFATLYHSDAIGPLTSHIMWTSQLQFGGVAGGNSFTTGGEDPNSPEGVQYWEGSSYQPRFVNPIILDGYLFYTEPVSFSGGASGPTVCVNLMTGQQLWSSTAIPPLSFVYLYNLWDPDQHGVFPPILVATNPVNGNWQLYDAYTGLSLFNVTGVPSSTSFVIPVSTTTVTFANTVASPNIMGPSGEPLRLIIANDGTAANPQWYLAEWNMSKLWQYDINPYTGGGSLSPAVVNASNGVLIGGAVVSSAGSGSLPPPDTGISTGTAPNGLTATVPYNSVITVNANIPIHDTANLPGTTTPIYTINQDSLTTYDWNVSIPWLNTMAPPPATVNPVTGALVQPPAGANPVSIVALQYGNMMLCRWGSLPQGFAATNKGYPQLPFTYFAVNLNSSRGGIGTILWSKTYNPPAGNESLVQEPVDFQTGVFVLSLQETMQFVGYSLSSGNQIWGPTPSQGAWDYYGYPGTVQLPGVVAYGNLYDSSFGGICYCYSDTTGQLLWTYGNGAPGSDNSTYGGLNVFYGDYPTQIQAVGNGVIYLATNEHTVPNPIYKGAVTFAINATTGQLIWKLSDYPSEWNLPGSEYVVGDGFATFMNGYNNQIYSVGRGPSKTTVTSPDIGVTTATPVTITGTVMDISAGTTQSQQAADFPNGVPCSSDASMTAWMGYVYQQQPEPTNFTGVQVTIAVTDSNNNCYNIGTAVTNPDGFYSLTWTPTISGNFTVTATFAGTNAYWPSSSTTAFFASTPAPTGAPAATPLTGLASNTTLEYGIVAIAIIIIVIGAVLALLVTRKRP